LLVVVVVAPSSSGAQSAEKNKHKRQNTMTIRKKKAAKKAASVRLHRLDRAQPHPRDFDYTVSEWCQRRRISKFLFYQMLKAGTAPRTMKLNKRRTISVSADLAWQEARESESESTKAS
jgi:hypothetical protein